MMEPVARATTDKMETVTVEQQPMKVYELAKELGIPPLALLEKLNSLNIKVKSHMSDLDLNDVQAARASLSSKQSTSKPGSKASGKKAETKVASPAATTDSTAVKKSVVKTKRKAATAPTTEAVSAPAAAAPAPTTPGSDAAGTSAIIRRRTKQDGSSETTVSVVSSGTTISSTTFTSDEAAAASFREEAPATTEEAQAIEGEYTTTEMQDTTSGAPIESVEAASTEAVSVKPELQLPIRPVAPKRSFLKIAQHTAPIPMKIISKAPPAPAPGTAAANAAGQKTNLKGAATQDKDGFRIIRMTKENLDQMMEEEAAKKRSGARLETEIRPEDVRFADYRKKEMVFLPKRKKLPVGKELKRTQITTSKAIKRVVEMGATISVQDLAAQMSVKATDVIRKLMGMGQMATMNQSLDFDTVSLIAPEYHYEVKNISFKEENLIESTTSDAADTLVNRPPIVTIMGHVDHGKTSLLDAIRSADVAGGEAGGITQHIGAYTVEQNGKKITFIDTPGHEAFAMMRARGANSTDIVILVVAADDGVMPQTREALSHAQAAKVPIIVAVNKIDKPGATPDRVRQGLSDLGLVPEDWGGETMFVPVSALKKQNLDKLLEAVLLQAEVLDLKANPEARASGLVLESRIVKGRGAVVSLLVKRGTLRVGDSILAGQLMGKVKALLNDKGQTMKEVPPGVAVEVLGFEGVPNAGEKFDIMENENDARSVMQNRIDKARSEQAATKSSKVSLEELFSKVQTGDVKELGVIIKADVYGSAEAIKDSLLKISSKQVKINVLHSAAGGITENDVLLASASQAIIIGFNIRPETKARQLAESEHIEIKCYNIIYELIDDVKKAMAGLLDKKKVEKFLGRAEVRQTFTVPKQGTVAGSAVIDGKIVRGANVRLLRDSRVIFEGKMSSLRRFKDDAKEVATGFECGIGIENYNDVKAGDIIEAYQIDLITPELQA